MKRACLALLLPLLIGGPVVCGAEEPAPRKPDVGYYPTAQDVVEKILAVAEVNRDDVVCDLGCGDGRYVVTAAKKYGCRAVGYEIDPKLVKRARASVRKNDVEQLARIEQQDIFTADLSEMSVVTMFLLPDLHVRLVPQLNRMKPGSRVVTHEFEIEGYQPEQMLTYVSQDDNSEHLIYVYRVPLRRVPAAE